MLHATLSNTCAIPEHRNQKQTRVYRCSTRTASAAYAYMVGISVWTGSAHWKTEDLCYRYERIGTFDILGRNNNNNTHCLCKDFMHNACSMCVKIILSTDSHVNMVSNLGSSFM